jgi:hypothetical protein
VKVFTTFVRGKFLEKITHAIDVLNRETVVRTEKESVAHDRIRIFEIA